MNLKETVKLFYQEKQSFDNLKKGVDKLNLKIKEMMQKEGTDEVEVDGIKAKRTVSERTSFIDEILLETIKELKIPGIIKTKEYVDMSALETAIYKRQIIPQSWKSI